MPIIGLTDRPAALPQIGVLRKGAPKPQNGIGKDLDYFRFDCNDPDVVDTFQEFYGSEPRVIHVYVPYATTGENFEAWKEEYVASGLKHRCDGQTCVIRLLNNGTYSTEAAPCPGGCKQVGRLKVIIPELKRLAFVTVLTTSIHDIIELNSNLLALETSRGSLQGIPMILKRAPRKISTPSGTNGQRARREKWLLTLEAQPKWAELLLTSQEHAALPVAEPLALPEWEGEEEEAARSHEPNDEKMAEFEAAHQELEAEMKEIFISAGKPESEWSRVYNDTGLADRTLIDKRALLDRWKAAAAERKNGAAKPEEPAPIQAEQPNLTADHHALKGLIKQFIDAGILSQGEIDDHIGRICVGEYEVERLNPGEAAKAAMSLQNLFDQSTQTQTQKKGAKK